MKKSYLVFVLVAIVAISCGSNPKLRAIKAKPEMQSVIDKYKDELKSKSIRVNTAWTKFDTIVTHKVLITVLNPDVSPKGSDFLSTLAKNIAKDIYLEIVNNNDFSTIDITFKWMIGFSLVNVQTNRTFSFPTKELDGSIL